ncbi:nuclear transport factor 2 family protein [Flaviaesturariibacter amylovorans]|uniref:Nuclear transport factor 2 family protein n=1 Tax=Flaviaesturariibacter amylovorans TaxID=1084520 RepID=A0ABP8GC55_9BACT
MKQIPVLLALFLAPAGLRAQTDQKELAEVAKVVSYYLDGGTLADSLQFSKAFYPQGQMLFMRNDTTRIVALKDFMAGARNDGKRTDRKTRIDAIHIYGNAAQAKLTVEYPTFYFHDMMSLLKTKEGWKIVNKIFYREEKPNN